MRRIVTCIVGAALAGMLLAAPATAAQPARGCPDGFDLMKLTDPALKNEDRALLDSIDANNDGKLCVAFLPEKNGAGTTNKIDNVSNQ